MRFLHPRNLGICLHCAYDLSGSAAALRCPECGAAIEPFDLLRPRRLMLLAALAIIPGALACLALAMLPQSAHAFAKPDASLLNKTWGRALLLALLVGPHFLGLAHCFVIAILLTRMQTPPALRGLRSSGVWRRLKRERRFPRGYQLAYVIQFVAAMILAGAFDSLAIGLWFRVALAAGTATSSP